MADQVEIQLPKTVFPEKTGFTATAYFRDRASKAASTPTTVEYRVDCLTTGKALKDWTTVSAAANVSISITYDLNAIQDDCLPNEHKQLVVAVDRNLSTMAINSVKWRVDNLYGLT